MEKTQKINLMPHYSMQDIKTLLLVFAYSALSIMLTTFVVAGILYGANQIFFSRIFYDQPYSPDLDYLASFFLGMIAPVLMLAAMTSYILYPRFARKPIPTSIEYDIVNKKLLIHHSNTKLFPPRIIRLDEISEVTYNYAREVNGGTRVDFDLKTANNGNFSLCGLDYNSQYVKFIAVLEAYKEQEGFESKLQNFPKNLLSLIDEYKHKGKLPFHRDNELLIIAVIGIVFSLLYFCNYFLSNR